MGEIVKLPERKPIPPKSETFTHLGQKYTCTFDPNALPDKQWVWSVKFVRTYMHFGSCATLQAAMTKAKKQIHAMNMHTIEMEENE